MMNNMDILIIVFIAIIGAAVLGLGLMFFGKKAWQRRIGFFHHHAVGHLCSLGKRKSIIGNVPAAVCFGYRYGCFKCCCVCS